MVMKLIFLLNLSDSLGTFRHDDQITHIDYVWSCPILKGLAHISDYNPISIMISHCSPPLQNLPMPMCEYLQLHILKTAIATPFITVGNNYTLKVPKDLEILSYSASHDTSLGQFVENGFLKTLFDKNPQQLMDKAQLLVDMFGESANPNNFTLQVAATNIQPSNFSLIFSIALYASSRSWDYFATRAYTRFGDMGDSESECPSANDDTPKPVHVTPRDANESNDEQEQVRDIIVYDIPYIWDVEKILGEKLSLKRQHKYQTLQVKIVLNSFTTLPQFNKFWMIDLAGIPVRWFPASWTLQERKQREKFQAVIHDIPEEMMMATFLTACGASAFKIIQTSKGKRKLVGYFENWEATLKALGTPQKALTKQKAKNVPDKKPGKSVQQSGNVNLKKKDQKSSTSAKKQAKSTKDSLKDPKSQKLKSNKKSSDKGDLVVIRIIDFISE
ncbi:hypothetical protein RhiirA5_427493 [Rhizophagus irregularis]|uniref:Uncharacterized protein n=1 Tax=Rhizophagus irregularis TaxID=588596 RepID=A0A2N0P284_9GLOM|nr:hypothetical protein RhiirA5_427493 [Rhizophagus irregularis]